MSKCGSIRIRTKKPWEVSRGHNSYRSGSGNHDNRPRRIRTRMDVRKKAIEEGMQINWLDRQPVTLEVAGSSPVILAKVLI